MTQIPNAVIKQLANDHPPLAPDGLPWPEGYFDRIPPKQSIEQAVAIHGVRPSHYVFGWPGYTTEEMALPEFKSLPPPEPPELEEKWRNECDEWDAQNNVIAGTHLA